MANNYQSVYMALRQEAENNVALILASCRALKRSYHENMGNHVDVGYHNAFLLPLKMLSNCCL